MPRAVWVLTLNNFFIAVGFGVMMPVLPVFARSFHVSTFMVSWIISGFALMRILTSPWCGRLITLIGEKACLGIGIFAVAASSTAAGLATSFWQLLMYRGIGGIGSAIFAVAAMTMLLRVSPPDARGAATGLYQSGFVIGGMAGPALGGLVATISMSAPFFFYSCTLVIGGILVLLLIPSDAEATTSTKDTRGSMPLREAWADARYRTACVAGFAQGWQSMGARSVLLALMVTEVLHRSAAWTGYVSAAAAVAQALSLTYIGHLVDARGRKLMLGLGLAITCVMNFFTPLTSSIWLLMALVTLYALGASSIGTASMAAVGDVAGRRGGTPVAVFSMTQDIGVVIGPLVAGWIADRAGMSWAFWAGSLLFLAALAYTIVSMPGRLDNVPTTATPLAKENV
ncbi:MAG: MFS transporter [Propionibacteriaceae bacterium]